MDKKLAEREAAVLRVIVGALRIAVLALPEASELTPLIASWADDCQAEAALRAGRPLLRVV